MKPIIHGKAISIHSLITYEPIKQYTGHHFWNYVLKKEKLKRWVLTCHLTNWKKIFTKPVHFQFVLY